MRTTNTLIRMGGHPGWSESLLCVLVLSWGGSYNKEYDRTVQHHRSNIWEGILFFYAYGWLSLQNYRMLLPCSLVSMATPACYEHGVSHLYSCHGNSHVSFMLMADYPFKINKCCCHAALFLCNSSILWTWGASVIQLPWQQSHDFSKKITANLIDKICYYALHMNESALNDSKNFRFLTLFKWM